MYNFNTCPIITLQAPYGNRQVSTQVHMEKQTCKNTQEKTWNKKGYREMGGI